MIEKPKITEKFGSWGIPVWDYHNPWLQKTINGKDYRITREGDRGKNGEQLFRLYERGKNIFIGPVEQCKAIAEKRGISK